MGLDYEAGRDAEAYSVKLHCQEGSSDKIYELTIEACDGGLWTCRYRNGRRGGTMVGGDKTPAPTTYAAARQVCNKTLQAKVAKGYHPVDGSVFGGSGATVAKAASIATLERKRSGIALQLLLAADAGHVDALIADDRYWMEEKHDGERRALVVEPDVEPYGSNRRAMTVTLGAPLAAAAAVVASNQRTAGIGRLVLDGEQVGDALRVWDVLELGGRDLRKLPLRKRAELLDAMDFGGQMAISRTRRAETAAEKRSLFEAVAKRKGEGVVFKDREAAFEAGAPRPASPWIKVKFWNSLSAVVSAVNAQRSVSLDLLDGTARLAVGSVTIPSNCEVPEVGDVVEVRYLYAYEGGRLYQPVYLGTRKDVEPEECGESQRVFKATEEAA